MRGAYLRMRLCCLAEQEEQEWLRLMRETEEPAEEASPCAAASDDAHCPGAVRDLAQPADLTSHLVPAASGVWKDSPVCEKELATLHAGFGLVWQVLPGSHTVR